MIYINNRISNINGIRYDFNGYNAKLDFNGKIIKVIRISDGKDVTEKMIEKYKWFLPIM